MFEEMEKSSGVVIAEGLRVGHERGRETGDGFLYSGVAVIEKCFLELGAVSPL